MMLRYTSRSILRTGIRSTQLRFNGEVSKPLYTPQDPLSIPSQSHEIEAKIQRLKRKLEEQEQQRKNEIVKDKLSIWDVAAPLLNVLLVGSTVYIALQYAWLLLEREEIIEAHTVEMEALQREIQALLEGRPAEKKSWYKFW